MVAASKKVGGRALSDFAMAFCIWRTRRSRESAGMGRRLTWILSRKSRR